MPLESLFHVAIKTADLARTRSFYIQVMGMVEAPRAAIPFPGIWIAPAPGSDPIFHIYAGDAALEADGSMARGSGVLDHVSVMARGYHASRARVQSAGLPYRENVLPDVGLWQLFVHDPNGVMLELTFVAAREEGQPPAVPPERQYRAREIFFNPDAYAGLPAGAPSTDRN